MRSLFLLAVFGASLHGLDESRADKPAEQLRVNGAKGGPIMNRANLAKMSTSSAASRSWPL
ncbi:MAG: hypothetical protein DME39_01635 [Verrucomicrobia bacterium]|nr:MAG: hypothetical protein DME39_01635 [Verrucomicrobiota bacterium]